MFSFLEEQFFHFFSFIKNHLAFGDFGLAIVFFALFIKIVLLPLEKRNLKYQQEMSLLQEKLKEIKEKYKKDQAMQQKKILELFKEKNINPLPGLFSLILQIPFLILVFRLIKTEVLLNSSGHLFLNVFNLSQPNPFFAFLTSAFQIIFQPIKQNQGIGSALNSYFFPLMSFIIFLQLPVGLLLYIFSNFLFSLLFSKIFLKNKNE